jgi:L-fucose mutarotase
MLKGIDELLTPDLLRALAAMGHNEWVAIVDANYTAEWLAGQRPLIRLPGQTLPRIAQAVLSVLPLANDVAYPFAYMHHCGASATFQTPAQQAAVAVAVTQGLASAEPPSVVVNEATPTDAPSRDGATGVQALERFTFYKQMARASVIIQSGEMTPYGNVLLCKGLITHSFNLAHDAS